MIWLCIFAVLYAVAVGIIGVTFFYALKPPKRYRTISSLRPGSPSYFQVFENGKWRDRK